MSDNNIELLELATSGQANIGEVHECWHTFPKWDDSRVANILNAAGANDKRQVTSYPSPVARMHLFNDAFKFYLEKQNTDEDLSFYSRLISQCLDVWEILFYYDLTKDKLRFRSWTFDNIDTLKEAKSGDGHRMLGNSLDLFMRKDEHLPLSNCSEILLIIYDGLTVAGSSPFTGFFTSSDLSGVDLSIPGRAKDKYFETIRHLDERDMEFQKYLHMLAKVENFYGYFNDLFNYIKQFNRSSDPIKAIWSGEEGIDTLKERLESDYELIRNPATLKLLDKSEGGGFELRKFRPRVAEDCYFTIQSSLWKRNFPLALMTKPDGKDQKSYVSGKVWDEELEVPLYVEEQDLSKRRLPGVNIEYPYVTLGDFMEDYLIQLPYPINDEAFMTCAEGHRESAFLLPVKPLIFQFFTVNEVRQYFTLEYIEAFNAKVRATLKIPLVGDKFLTFSKDYDFLENPMDIPTPSEIKDTGENQGYVLEAYRLGLWVYPFIKTGVAAYDNFYRVGLVDDDASTSKVAMLDFYEEGRPIVGRGDLSPVSRKTRVQKQYDKHGSEYYALEFDPEENTSLDTIRVTINVRGADVSGMIIPMWHQAHTGDEYSYEFSVDFGTTNTHVAYRRGNNNPKALDLGLEDDFQQVVRLDKASNLAEKGDTEPPIIRKTKERQLLEFIPSQIGKEYPFPLRTALSSASSVKVYGESELLTNCNILFAMMDSLKDPENRIHTNLKWGSENKDLSKERIKIYIRQLLYMIRTKVLLNGSDPALTKLYWFRPLSMSRAFTGRLKEIWEQESKKILHTEREPVFLTESLAPFIKIREDASLKGGTVLSIDIGGGTTDAVIFHKDKLQLSTSFTFASRVLFGDTKSKDEKNNGIVSFFKGVLARRIDDLIKAAEGQSDQQKANKYISIQDSFNRQVNGDNVRSEDQANFFFSVPELQFAEELRDAEDFKFVFLLYYAALHYHCARIFQERALPVPTDIAMSGNGSKVVKLITASNEDLKELIEAIYQEVLQKESIDIRLHLPSNPKEITCYGAFYYDEDMKKNNRDNPFVLAGEKFGSLTQDEHGKIRYADLSDVELELEGSEYKKFMELFFKLYEQLDFPNKYGVKVRNLKKTREYVLAQGQENFRNMLRSFQTNYGVTEDDEIQETLFFYAITGTMADLISEFTRLRNGKDSALQ